MLSGDNVTNDNINPCWNRIWELQNCSPIFRTVYSPFREKISAIYQRVQHCNNDLKLRKIICIKEHGTSEFVIGGWDVAHRIEMSSFYHYWTIKTRTNLKVLIFILFVAYKYSYMFCSTYTVHV